MKKWKLLKSDITFNSKWIRILNNTYEIDGEVRSDYFHVVRPSYVLIVAIDKSSNFIIERQYRRGVDDFVLEVPAGMIDDGETPIQTAERELEEETGYKGKAKLLGELGAQPGFMDMRGHIVLMEDCEQSGEKQRSIDENIEVLKYPANKVIKMLKNNEIKDMGSACALALYLLNKEI